MIQVQEKKTLTPDLIDSLREKSKESLYFFAKGVLGFDWLDERIHLPLCKKLEKKENTRIKVILPRGWLKTTVASCAYPLWRAIHDPNVRVLLCQNTFTNACQKLKRMRGTVEGNALFRILFPEILPTGRSTWKTDSLCLNRSKVFDESTFEAAGSGTQVTSRHYDVIIEDDSVAPEGDDLDIDVCAPSKDTVNKAIGWHRLADPLLNSPGESQKIVVGTRWGEVDLLSWIDENEPSYETYTRAAKEGEDGLPDVNGECVYPSRFNEEVLAGLEQTLGPYLYSALYMNSPMSSSQMTFQPEWIQYYDTEPSHLAIYTTVDLAGLPSETKGDPDYNVVLTAGKDLDTGNIYVLDFWRKRANPGEVIDEIFAQYKRRKFLKVRVEAVAYQATLQYWLKERMRKEGTHFVVENFTHGKRSKEARIQGLVPLFAAGRVFIRSHYKHLEQELLSYPMGQHDDGPDTLSMQVPMWRATRSREDVKRDENAKNPLSFDSAIRELQGRQVKKQGFPYDVMVKTS